MSAASQMLRVRNAARAKKSNREIDPGATRVLLVFLPVRADHLGLGYMKFEPLVFHPLMKNRHARRGDGDGETPYEVSTFKSLNSLVTEEVLPGPSVRNFLAGSLGELMGGGSNSARGAIEIENLAGIEDPDKLDYLQNVVLPDSEHACTECGFHRPETVAQQEGLHRRLDHHVGVCIPARFDADSEEAKTARFVLTGSETSRAWKEGRLGDISEEILDAKSGGVGRRRLSWVENLWRAQCDIELPEGIEAAGDVIGKGEFTGKFSRKGAKAAGQQAAALQLPPELTELMMAALKERSTTPEGISPEEVERRVAEATAAAVDRTLSQIDEIIARKLAEAGTKTKKPEKTETKE